MKSNLILLLSLLVFQTINAQDYAWAKKWGAGGNKGCLINDITVDQHGNIYTIGEFQSQVDFDPGPSIFNLSASGSADAFVTKLDSNGNFIWAIKFTGSGYIQGNSIDVDTIGNIYTTGVFGSPSGDFDPGPGTAYLSGSGNSVFISKLNSDGDFIWAKSVSGNGDERGTSLKVDRGGNVYLTGQFTSTADFDPNGGIVSLVPEGGIDAFVLKLDSGGNYVWVKQLSGLSDEYANDITIDESDNIVTTGWFYGTIDLDPGTGSQLATQTGTSSDMFIVKLDSNGDFIFGNTVNSSSYVQGRGVDTDDLNNIYITGNYQGTADFNSDLGLVYNLTSSSSDGFILKLNSLGVFQWANTFISSSFCSAESINVNGNLVYSTGYFNGTVDLDPGLGSSVLSSSGSGRDVYISKLNTQGLFIWGGELNGTGVYMNEARGIAVNNNEIHVSGSFMGSVDFDPGVGTATLSSVNNSQGSSFVVKLTPQCFNSTSYISPISCNAYTAADGSVYNSSGIYTATIPNSAGCDSVITIDLTILQSTSSSISPQSCGSYTAPDSTIHSSSGTFTSVIPNAAGCDSIITVNLTINPLPSINAGPDTVICSGSSIILSAAGGISYFWDNGVTNGAPFIPSGTVTYNVTGTSASGCTNTDQVIVTVNTLPIVSFSATQTSGCSPLSVSFTNTTLNVISSSWSFGNGSTSSLNNPTATFVIEGCYDILLTVLDSNGCSSNAVFVDSICIYPSPTAGFTSSSATITDNQLVTFTNTSTGANSYSWNLGDGSPLQSSQNITHTYNLNNEDSLVILLIASNSLGCSDTASLILDVKYTPTVDDGLYIPTGFSPNNDGENDSWTITGLENYPNAFIQVFNRWGQVVFDGGQANPTWDGYFQGKLMPTADYYFIVDLGTIEKINGVVTLKQ